MDIRLQPVVIFIGNYGSGKTEVSVNFALHQIEKNMPVRIVDLDIVNPYFRSREVRETMKEYGIEVIVPQDQFLQADLPVVVPQMKGAIQNENGCSILDVGGDDVGATVLGSFKQAISQAHVDLLQVVNVKRPFTETVEGALRISAEIEQAAKQNVTGIVGNSHLMGDTDVATIREGYEYAQEVAAAKGVPLAFITCEKRLLPELDPGEFACPVLPIERLLLPPWQRREKLGSQNFLLS